MNQRGSSFITHMAITVFIIAAIAFLPKGKSYISPTKIPDKLPVVGTFGKLKSLLKEMKSDEYRSYGGEGRGVLPLTSAPRVEKSMQVEAMTEGTADSAATLSDFSKTNVQVQGVDEADIVKTDGKYIYKINARKLSVVKVVPANKMQIVSEIDFGAEGFTPTEIYVDDEYLTVIGQAVEQPGLMEPQAERRDNMRIQPNPTKVTVKALVFDISDKTNPRQIREVEIEGRYLSSRKIGSAIYLVANKDLDLYAIDRESKDTSREVTPVYRDSVQSDEYQRIDYSEIKYFPRPSQSNYLLVAGLDLREPNRAMTVKTYLGAGQNIYASTKNLYVAAVKPANSPSENGTTAIYKFALQNGDVNYRARGEVPGTILNQFSMDEQDQHFRIATTEQRFEPSDNMTQTNNLFVLDGNLEITGKITGIAPGEKIYSVRFMGDRAYMVTFKKVDPLFVIDLSDPAAPRIQGELKIPGYSDYLHVYDENHIIGFGKDAVAAESSPGMPERDFAYYQGIKIAVFDVTDVEHPVEKFKTIVGDRGTESELLQNHKALLFDKDKNLLAFPVTVMEIKDKPATGLMPDNIPAYGEFAFQGAYVYNIDINKGLELKGKITHLQNRYQDQWAGDRQVKRVLRINDTLFTVSDGMIKANDLKTLDEKTKLAL